MKTAKDFYARRPPSWPSWVDVLLHFHYIYMHLMNLWRLTTLGLVLLSAVWMSSLEAVEVVAHVNIRPTPVKRANRYADEKNPTAKELAHIPKLNVIETTDKLLIDASTDHDMGSENEYIRGYMLYVNQTVISKAMFTPGMSKARWYLEIDKKYLEKGDQISLITDCNVEEFNGIDFRYHMEPTPNVYVNYKF